MALSNAERQARWREKRNALAKQAAAGSDPERISQFSANAAALLFSLAEEGRKDLATFSPNTVRRYTKLLQDQVDALRTGDSLPDLSGLEKRRAEKAAQIYEDEDPSWLPKALRRVT